MTSASIPSPFSSDQWQRIDALINTLDQSQRMWLSGYLAAGQQLTQDAVASNNTPSSSLLIAFATETDNSRHLAHRLEARCREQGLNPVVEDLADLSVRRLRRFDTLIVITATHGEGDPPEPATSFFEALLDERAPKLDGTSFAVLALGDSSYEQFCVSGRQVDERLAELGSKRLVDREECDVDFAAPAKAWMDQVLAQLPTADTVQQPVSPPASQSGVAPAAATSAVSVPDRHHPVTVELIDKVQLTHQDREAPIYHLVLAHEPGHLDIAPGDALGVLAENPPALIAQVLDSLGWSGELPVTIDGKALTLVEALRQKLDINIPSPALLAVLNAPDDGSPAGEVLQADKPSQRRFLARRRVLDLLLGRSQALEPQALVEALRPLQPRLYDVANSMTLIDDEMHLTVKAFHYQVGDKRQPGVASHYLLDLAPGDTLAVYPHRNARFHLPDDEHSPLILIAEGTGIAPYRAFLQALTETQRPGPLWLVFGEQSYEEDFLYQTDIQKAHDAGRIQHIDLAFPQLNGSDTLAAALHKHADRLGEWIGQGAEIYLSGEKDLLKPCEDTMTELIDGRMGEGSWKQLTREKRIHRNLY